MLDTKTALLAALCTMAVAFGGCSDDDNNKPTPDTGAKDMVVADRGTSDQAATDMGAPDMAAPKPRGKDDPPTLGTQIDRVGRPAISSALIKTFEGDETKRNAAKDAYNAASPANQPSYVPDIKAGLAILDALDQNCGNQLAADLTAGKRYEFLATVLANDQLWVNAASGSCGGSDGGTYLGVEAEALSVLSAGQGGCGGRTPKEDVIERTYSVLAAGVLSGIDDTVEGDGKPHDKDVFPFLAAPNP